MRSKYRSHTKEQRTSEKQPEGPPPDLAFDQVKSLVGRFFVHAKCNGDVRRFTESRMLGSVMAFAEMIYTVAVYRRSGE